MSGLPQLRDLASGELQRKWGRPQDSESTVEKDSTRGARWDSDVLQGCALYRGMPGIYTATQAGHAAAQAQTVALRWNEEGSQ